MLRLFFIGTALVALAIFNAAAATLPVVRPPVKDRTFQSTAVDNLITTLSPLFANPDLAALFTNCLPNTLDTTVYYHTPASEANSTNLDTFVITGDIEAMWLRDSSNQVLPYIPYATSDPDLQLMLEGLIARQAKSVLIDPFANAFNFKASGQGHQSDTRKPPMGPAVFEGKYEIDSLAAFLKLSYWHWRYSGDAALVRFATSSWLDAVGKLIDTVQKMQRDSGQSPDSPYLFGRVTSEALDTLSVQTRGPPARPHHPKGASQEVWGLTRSLFRPSDDAVTLPYNIPGNAMICVELNHLQELLTHLESQASDSTASQVKSLLQQARLTATGICSSLKDVLHTSGLTESSLPYEIDGFGGQYYMDDANVPSLLSLPVLGYLSSENAAYARTRAAVLSDANPYFFSGTQGKGIGGPHEGVNYTWPMALITQAMTSNDDNEVTWCLDLLVRSSAGTGLMHEAFDVNNVGRYTRSWFAWANGLLGELLLQLIVTKPHLVLVDDAEAVKTAQAAVQVPICLAAQREVLVK
uniref:Glycoside hydrolase family 125 protein n=2 Tax=Spumella elongata TaxID=89044 RepID=A0A7S3M840_9STRA|mmetsp:Transcript_36026/g.62084  ORF Transcript_36026/g.62084 Transcript_36026/m.62084 type:complete len:525 (+) Transcript_36026:3-1577(+)